MDNLFSYSNRNDPVRHTSVLAYMEANKKNTRGKIVACLLEGRQPAYSATQIAKLTRTELLTIRPAITALAKDNMLREVGESTTDCGKTEITWALTDPVMWKQKPARQTARERIEELEREVERLRGLIKVSTAKLERAKEGLRACMFAENGWDIDRANRLAAQCFKDIEND